MLDGSTIKFNVSEVALQLDLCAELGHGRSFKSARVSQFDLQNQKGEYIRLDISTQEFENGCVTFEVSLPANIDLDEQHQISVIYTVVSPFPRNRDHVDTRSWRLDYNVYSGLLREQGVAHNGVISAGSND